MVVVQFLLELAAATILLLFAVRMVRTGIERAFGASFRRMVTGSKARVRATLAGMVLSAIMQSSVAVAMIVAGFVGAGTLSCLLYTSPSPRDKRQSRMPSSA